MISIMRYKDLIKSIPYEELSDTTKRDTWKKFEKQNPQLRTLNNKIFTDLTSLEISRKELLRSHDNTDVFILKVIYWGYPNGMRGNNFKKILDKDNFSRLSKLITDIKKMNKSIDFKDLISSFKKINGVSISTYSKFLYFLKKEIEGNRCLILDLILIDVFNRKLFEEFIELKELRYENAERKYSTYLGLMGSISNDIKVNPDQLEIFLYTFGRNLKPSF